MKGTKVIVTYKCNCRCHSCEFSCGPEKKGYMRPDSFKKEVLEAAEEGYSDYVTIAGGEPFLRPGMIIKYLKSINNLNGIKSIITNGFWGSSEGYIYMLSEMKTMGLNNVIIDFGYMNNDFIDFSTVLGAVRLTERAELKATLRIGFVTEGIKHPWDQEMFENIKKLKVSDQKLKFIFYSLRESEFKEQKKESHEKLILPKWGSCGKDNIIYA